jgi:hypothetical protein
MTITHARLARLASAKIDQIHDDHDALVAELKALQNGINAMITRRNAAIWASDPKTLHHANYRLMVDRKKMTLLIRRLNKLEGKDE